MPVPNNEKTIEQEYNPFQHRTIKHPNNFMDAVIHMIKGSLGTGILTMPRAFKNTGLLVGFIGTIFIGCLYTYCMHLLVGASQEICKRCKVPSLEYAETVEGAFRNGPDSLRRWSHTAKIFFDIFQVCSILLGMAVLFMYIIESVTKSLSIFFKDTESWYPYIIVIVMILLIIFGQIRKLKHLVPLSFIANLTLIIAIGITMYYIFLNLKEVNISDRKLAKDVTGIPSFFATVLYAIFGVPTTIPVANSMTKPKFLGCLGVLNVALIVIVLLYTAIGFFGYLSFGEETETLITNILPPEEIPARVAQICISLEVFFTFLFQFYVPMDITWRRLKNFIPKERRNLCQIVLRTGGVILITGIAAAGQHNLDGLIDLFGAIFISTVSLFVPALLDIIVYWNNWGFCKWILCKNIFIMIISLFGLVSGTFYAVLNFVTT